MNADDKEDEITLKLLGVIDNNNDVSQRHLAKELGVALGLTNSYLKRCVRKGLIKIKQAPANRYFYYLTPKGFAEKSRLTAEFFTSSFSFYRQASESCQRAILEIIERRFDKVIFCGASELAEIASLRAMENGIEITGIYDPLFAKKKFLGHRVRVNLRSLRDDEVCLLTSVVNASDMYEQSASRIGSGKIIVPDIIEKLITSEKTQ